ncbi:hypothetical protein SETIT_4G150800v2 [Setaria italica]|uniref:Uncharacterized protein n=1 Tax=Setaria italica TaxID=4555 RepID=A0A368QUY6_SETIT|nr:hypothetical protein SETIT_4G150800v2 [Setaria italica]
MEGEGEMPYRRFGGGREEQPQLEATSPQRLRAGPIPSPVEARAEDPIPSGTSGGPHHRQRRARRIRLREREPRWTDQPTIAWLVEERAGVGVRAAVDFEGAVDRDELRRCVETVMGNGERAAEIRARVVRWMERVREAVAGGGTSEKNIWAVIRTSVLGAF